MGCHACVDGQRRKGHGISAEGGFGGRDTLSAWPSMASVGWKWRGRATSTRRGGSHLRVSNERPRSLSAPDGPQGVVYVPENDRIVVANRGDRQIIPGGSPRQQTGRISVYEPTP